MGNSLPIYRIHVKPEIKNISLYPKAKSVLILGHPVLLRRASAVVTAVGRVAVDADVAIDERG
jgi:hypothetical protein